MRRITEGRVIQAQELQGPLQLLKRRDAALARFNAERESKNLMMKTFGLDVKTKSWVRSPTLVDPMLLQSAELCSCRA